jgi:hypothetical protein
MLNKNSLRSHSGGLRKQQELNPIEGAFNLVDAMLVFSCGLMAALILNWGVKLTPVGGVDLSKSKEFSQSYENSKDTSVGLHAGNGYEEMGAVYLDKKTGKLYLISPDDQNSQSSQKPQNNLASSKGGE